MTDPNDERRAQLTTWLTILLAAAIAAPAIVAYLVAGPDGWFWPLLAVAAFGLLPAAFIADAIAWRLYPHKPDPAEMITGESYAESLHRAVREIEHERHLDEQ